MSEPVVNWIEEWVELYPEDAEFNGRLLRSKVENCVTKMQKFCVKYPQYTKDVIFAATKMYIEAQRQKGFEYTKQSTYFIGKLGEPSVLQEYCERVINNKPVKKEIEISPISDFI